MAPKDDSSKNQLVFGNSSFEEEEEKEKSQFDEKGWKQRLVVTLRQWFIDGHNGREKDSSSSGNYRWAATALLAVAALSLYKLRGSDRLKLTRQRRLWPVFLAIFHRPDHHAAVEVSLSLLRAAAKQGLVHRALVGSGEIVFQDTVGGRWKRSKLPPNSPSLQSEFLDVLSRGGCSDISALPESLSSRLATPILAALPFIYLAFMYRILKNMHGGDMGASKLLNQNNTSQTTRFTDIAGLDPIMREVQEIVSFLRNPSRYHAVGAQPPRGVLLHGPPGSGKTLLARALAGEANCDTFIACSGSEFCEMYVGRGASRVRSLFDKARSHARRTQRRHLDSRWWRPSQQQEERPATAIIFIDELDALAKSRSYGGLTSNDERDQTLNQLLTEMDGFPSQDTEVTIIVIAATNRADVLDPAILRRFDRQIHVPYPDQEGRRDILKIHARRTNCHLNQVDWDHLASHEMTDNFSGSDLRNLVNDAALLAVRDQSSTVTQSHFVHAIRRARAMKVNSNLMGSSTTSQPHLWFQKEID